MAECAGSAQVSRSDEPFSMVGQNKMTKVGLLGDGRRVYHDVSSSICLSMHRLHKALNEMAESHLVMHLNVIRQGRKARFQKLKS